MFQLNRNSHLHLPLWVTKKKPHLSLSFTNLKPKIIYSNLIQNSSISANPSSMEDGSKPSIIVPFQNAHFPLNWFCGKTHA